MRVVADEETLLTKTELAAALGRSERWVELRQREGLPVATTNRFGHKRYRLEDVQAWVEGGPGPNERLAALEDQMREVRERLEMQG